MGDIGTPITETIPAVGSSGTTYATNVNLFLTEVKNRLEAQVPRSSLADGNLDLNGFALQNSDYIGIADQVAAPTTPVNTLQAYNGEIYWISTSGAVQLTSGGSINTSIIGGITGDYGSPNPAEFRFVDADQEYYAYDDFGAGTWANVWARHFDIAAGATSTNRVRLEYGGAGSYTLTLPPAAPAASSGLQMSSSGAVTTYTGATRTLVIPVSPGWDIGGGWTYNYSIPNLFLYNTATSSGPGLNIPLILPVGCTITNITLSIDKVTTNAVTLQADLWYLVNGGATSLASDTTNGNATGIETLTLGPLNETTSSSASYVLDLRKTVGTATGDKFYYATVTYKEPLVTY